MSSEGTEGASPQCGPNPAFGRRDCGYLAGTPAARWSGTEPAISLLRDRLHDALGTEMQTRGRWGVCVISNGSELTYGARILGPCSPTGSQAPLLLLLLRPTSVAGRSY